jgi:o-succinylbenzoate---CoA ligase
MPEEDRRALEALAIDLPGHVWLATSGTTGSMKLTALSKRALLASAAAVNRFLDAGETDVWCRVLPAFHVGGLGIETRAHLSGARVVTMAWEPARFVAFSEMTLASLVPAQVSDVLAARLEPPRGLRAVIVGGGALRADLYDSARALGWPVLPSYGMTETCSQVATATPSGPELMLLDHVEARADADGRLAFRGSSLLTGYGTAEGFVDPKADGWFVTEDLGAVRGRMLVVEGRRGDFVKVGGESVDLGRLDAILATVGGVHAGVVAVADDRLGHVIHLVVDASLDGEAVAAAFNERVHPFERARKVHRVGEIPRSSLGKLRRSELASMLPESEE